VPRACVHTLAALRRDLEGAKEGVYDTTPALAALRDSQLVASAGALAGRLFGAGGAARVRVWSEGNAEPACNLQAFKCARTCQ